LIPLELLPGVLPVPILLRLLLLRARKLLQPLRFLQFIILPVVQLLRVQLLLRLAKRPQELPLPRLEQIQLYTNVSQVQELKPRFHLLLHTTHDIGMDHNGRNKPQRLKSQIRNNFRNRYGALRRNGRAHGRFRTSTRGTRKWV